MLKDREISFDFNGRMEVILIQCKFDVFYDFNSTQGLNYLMKFLYNFVLIRLIFFKSTYGDTHIVFFIMLGQINFTIQKY